jgi:nucleotide-binding universal stress UspA family protein
MARVLIALDGTELDTHLVDVARRVFGDDAEYLALNVRHTTIAPVPMYVGMTHPYIGDADVVEASTEESNAEADAARSHAASTVASTGLDAEAIGEIGNPAFTIPAVAEAHDVDVIVVGTHDRSWWSRFLEPSVAEGVLHQTDIPVLMVHTDRR